MKTQASAPGKIMLTGEYAVLTGSPALAAAAPMRVLAEAAEGPPTLLRRVHGAETPIHEGESHAVFARALERGVPAGRIVLDSSDLYARDGRKLGLGSSAAEPAALAAVLEMIPAPARPESLAELRALMRRPELEPGSGADLAAALLGGVRKVVVRDGEPHVTEAGLPDDDIFLALVYSGVSQPTRHLVSLFRQRQDHPADDFRRGLEELRDAAHLVSTSWKFTPVLAMWVWAERYTEFLRACLKEAWIDAYDPVLELAARHQGIARPTGAGGGDCLLAAFEEEPDRAAFLHDCAQRNWQAWAIALGAEGVRAG